MKSTENVRGYCVGFIDRGHNVSLVYYIPIVGVGYTVSLLFYFVFSFVIYYYWRLSHELVPLFPR